MPKISENNLFQGVIEKPITYKTAANRKQICGIKEFKFIQTFWACGSLRFNS